MILLFVNDEDIIFCEHIKNQSQLFSVSSCYAQKLRKREDGIIHQPDILPPSQTRSQVRTPTNQRQALIHVLPLCIP